MLTNGNRDIEFPVWKPGINLEFHLWNLDVLKKTGQNLSEIESFFRCINLAENRLLLPEGELL